jgi:hypothetical protein
MSDTELDDLKKRIRENLARAFSPEELAQIRSELKSQQPQLVEQVSQHMARTLRQEYKPHPDLGGVWLWSLDKPVRELTPDEVVDARRRGKLKI